jgi:hypothetical protein
MSADYCRQTPSVTSRTSCRAAVQQLVRGSWRTIRYDNKPADFCARRN